MAILERLYTASDLANLPDDGRRHILVKGRLVEMPPPKFLHGKIASLLGNALFNYARDRELGEVISHEIGYLLATDPDTILGPDISFVRADLFAQVVQDAGEDYAEQYFSFAPTLAVEIVSPSNSIGEIDDKVAAYLDAGAEMVWIVYPRRQHVEVYKADGEVRLLTGEDVLTGGDVLPGFELAIRDIFPEPKTDA